MSHHGFGPPAAHLQAAFHPAGNRTQIKVVFNHINAAVNQYDRQFRVFNNGVEVAITNVVRDPANAKIALITLAQATSGTTTVSYGDAVPASDGIWLTNVVKGANSLPAPLFGPINVVVDTAALAQATEGEDGGELGLDLGTVIDIDPGRG